MIGGKGSRNRALGQLLGWETGEISLRVGWQQGVRNPSLMRMSASFSPVPLNIVLIYVFRVVTYGSRVLSHVSRALIYLLPGLT